MTPENKKLGKWNIFNEKCKNGKIYIIKSKLDVDFSYIGGTYNDLDVRFKQHQTKSDSLGYFMFNYVRKYYLNDWSSFYITLLFDYPCNTIRELRNKETETILKLNPYNSPTRIELYSYNKIRDYDNKIRDYDNEPVIKDSLKTQKKVLEQMDYDDDNNIKCPYCLNMFKFYNVEGHVRSSYHNEIY